MGAASGERRRPLSLASPSPTSSSFAAVPRKGVLARLDGLGRPQKDRAVVDPAPCGPREVASASRRGGGARHPCCGWCTLRAPLPGRRTKLLEDVLDLQTSARLALPWLASSLFRRPSAKALLPSGPPPVVAAEHISPPQPLSGPTCVQPPVASHSPRPRTSSTARSSPPPKAPRRDHERPLDAPALCEMDRARPGHQPGRIDQGCVPLSLLLERVCTAYRETRD